MKWIKANTQRPKEGWHSGRYNNNPCAIDVNNGDIIITLPNGKIVTNPYLNELEWLGESTPDGWVRPPVTGSLLLLELMQVAAIKNEDGMPVVEYVDKPNGGSVAYLRHDAVVNKLNALINMPPPTTP